MAKFVCIVSMNSEGFYCCVHIELTDVRNTLFGVISSRWNFQIKLQMQVGGADKRRQWQLWQRERHKHRNSTLIFCRISQNNVLRRLFLHVPCAFVYWQRYLNWAKSPQLTGNVEYCIYTTGYLMPKTQSNVDVSSSSSSSESQAILTSQGSRRRTIIRNACL